MKRGFDANVGLFLAFFIGWCGGLTYAIAHPRQGLHDKMAKKNHEHA